MLDKNSVIENEDIVNDDDDYDELMDMPEFIEDEEETNQYNIPTPVKQTRKVSSFEGRCR